MSAENNIDFRNLRLALGGYLLIFILKITVYFMSGVMAVLAEAFHTLSDLFVSGFLLVAAYYSQRKPDAVHMFGYGRVQNAAALVAATLFISFTSFELYKEAIPRLFSDEPTDYQNLGLAVAVLVLSMIVAAVPMFQIIRHKSRGAAAKAQLLELVNDEIGLLAALAGTLFIAVGIHVADPLAAILVATIIAINAVGLFRENLCYLIGRSPDEATVEKIRTHTLGVPGVLGLHELRAEFIGPATVHVDLHIEVPASLTILEANQIAEQVDRSIHSNMPSGFCTIHVDAIESAA